MVRKTIAPGPVAALIALAAAVFMLVGGTDFCLDDAWIHLAYAKSLRLGDGLSYNPGDHETGFSSPLWVLLVAALPWPGSPVLPVKLLGALCHAALAWGVASTIELLARERTELNPRVLGAIGGVMCALDPALAFAATSGMEVSLTAALVVWTVYASLSGRSWLSAVLAAGSVLARPESLVFLAAWSALRSLALRDRKALVPLLAAGCAFALWTAYNLAVSGYPFPNTYYAKRSASLRFGLLYFLLEYLPEHAWVLGVGGVVLLAIAVARPGEPRRLFIAWLGACVVIAGTREIMPQVPFYFWRYFAVLGAIPCVVLMTALPARAALAAAALTPIAVATIWALPAARTLQHGQEEDIHLVHTEPAYYLARTVPRGGRVMIEGAGASRFFLPRDVRVIDSVGLNFKTVVHAADMRSKICEAIRLEPMFVSLPSNLYAVYEQVLVLQKLHEFVAPTYRLVRVPRPERVIAARVIEISRRVRDTCKMP